MFKKPFIAIITLTALAGCIGEENFENSNIGNFEALWKVVDEHYCFFDVAQKKYGLDWNNVYTKHKAFVDTCENDAELFTH